MIRHISFTDDGLGDIRVETETETTVIRSGVVLLTSEQVTRALAHGWERYGEGPFTTETESPLYAVRRA